MSVLLLLLPGSQKQKNKKLLRLKSVSESITWCCFSNRLNSNHLSYVFFIYLRVVAGVTCSCTNSLCCPAEHQYQPASSICSFFRVTAKDPILSSLMATEVSWYEPSEPVTTQERKSPERHHFFSASLSTKVTEESLKNDCRHKVTFTWSSQNKQRRFSGSQLWACFCRVGMWMNEGAADQVPVSLTVEAVKCQSAPFLPAQLVADYRQAWGTRVKSCQSWWRRLDSRVSGVSLLPWSTLMCMNAETSAVHPLPISTPHMYHPESASFRLFMVTVNTCWTWSSTILTLSSARLAPPASSVRAKLVQNSLMRPWHQYFT